MENQKGEILFYQREDGSAQIDVRLEEDTVWLTQAQLVILYQSSKANVSEHIKHILKKENSSKIQLFGISEQLLLMGKTTLQNTIILI